METIQKISRITLLLLLLFLMGCASNGALKQRYVWPPPPDEPKIEYLGTYKDQNDLLGRGIAALLLGEVTTDTLDNPGAIASDGLGKVYVVDAKNAVVVFDFNAKETHTFGQDIRKPSGIAIDGDGNIYVGDTEQRVITVFDKNEKMISSINLSVQAKSIGHFAIDKIHRRLAVPDPKANALHIFDLSGKFITTVDKYEGEEGTFNMPAAAAFDPQGNIVVTDSMNSHIVRISPEGKFLSLFGKRGDNAGGLSVIRGVAVDSEGHIYVTDAKAHKLNIFNEKGEVLLVIGAPNADAVGGFMIPFGIYIDQNDTIYIVEKFTKRFQKYQYVTAAYLAKNPFIKDTIAKPVFGKENKGEPVPVPK